MSKPRNTVLTSGGFTGTSGSAETVKITDPQIDYKEAVNTYYDKVDKYYFLTSRSDYTDGQIIFVPDIIDFADFYLPYLQVHAEVKKLENNEISSDITDVISDGSFAPNNTYLFDSGSFTIKLPSTLLFSAFHTSYLGVTNKPTIIFPYQSDGYLYRNVLGSAKIYFENIVFDGRGLNMQPTLGIGTSLFYVNSESTADGLVMRGITIRNLGAFPSALYRNIAITVNQSSGQINLENLTISNNKADVGGGNIQLLSVTDTYLRNITIDNSTGRNVNLGSSLTVPLIPARVVLDGSLVVTGNNAPIRIQDYRFDVYVPFRYHYVQYATSNGSSAAGTASALVWDRFPAPSSQYGIYQLIERAWIITGGADDLSIHKQIMTAATALAAISQFREIPDAVAFKLIAANSLLESFTLPDIASITGYSATIHLIAVNALNASIYTDDLITAVKGITINLNKNKAVFLYNIDFHDQANYTMQEAVFGITPLTPEATRLKDPFHDMGIPGYPVYESHAAKRYAAVPGSNREIFRYCLFTGLVGAVAASKPHLTLRTGDRAISSPSITGVYTIDGGVTDTIYSFADDPTLAWFLASGEGIVTIDAVTGVITALAPGNAIIILKALDVYNEGEIIKAFSAVTVTVAAAGEPVNVKARVKDKCSILVSWDSVPDANAYYLYQSPKESGPYELIAVVTNTKYTDAELIPATTYYYRVASMIGGDPGPLSDPVNATTWPAASVPPAPCNIHAAAICKSAIQISWDPLPEADRYELYRSQEEDGPYELIASTSNTAYTDVGLIPATVCYYKIAAYIGEGISPKSGPASATTFCPIPV